MEPQRVEPRRVGPKILRLFFLYSRHNFLSSSFVGFSRGLKRLGPKMCTFGVLGLSFVASNDGGLGFASDRNTGRPLRDVVP